MIILGIETSCDETGVAIVKDGTTILSNVVSSSSELQKKYGGVYPEIAAREQTKVMIPVLNETMTQAKISLKDINALAVTIGPGLIGSLLVGVETAKTISYVLNKPLVPVNHVLAHLYANWLASPNPPAGGEGGSSMIHYLPSFPALCLIVSGGHTDLLLMENHGKYKILGSTLDDAAGEAFDKTARLLGLSYPGGPEIAAEAAKFKINPPAGGEKLKIKLPRPMSTSKDLNFSFSGLKTAVLREYKKIPGLSEEIVSAFAYEIQEAITDILVKKTLQAVEEFKPKSLLLAGGVAANSRLHQKMKLKIENCKLKIKFYIPPPNLCTDNAAAIASFACFNYQPKPWKEIQAEASLFL